MRSYKQYCGVARALDLVGQRWALLIVRDLLPGPRRFADLALPGLTPNVLSERLKQLAEAGLVESVTLPAPASRKVWQLTEEGRRLEPVVLALGAFGARHLSTVDGYAMRARWMLVSLQRRYRGGIEGTVAIVVEGEAEAPYTLGITPEHLVVRDGMPASPDLRVSGPPQALGALLARGIREVPGLAITGDPALLEALLARLDPVSPP
ncbi:MAG: helix-turn-helix domain-containing protein [Myxococcota bacterium]